MHECTVKVCRHVLDLRTLCYYPAMCMNYLAHCTSVEAQSPKPDMELKYNVVPLASC